MKTFTAATKEFLDELGDFEGLDSATVTGLENAAKQLDLKFATSLLAEYNKTIRYIKSIAPTATDVDEDEEFLSPK